jgi:hypothetical protein
MRFSSFQHQGLLLTEKEVLLHASRVKASYRIALSNIKKRIDAFYIKSMVKTPKRWEITDIKRLEALEKQILNEYNKIIPAVQADVRKSSQTAFVNNYYRQQYAGQIFTQFTFAFSPVDVKAAEIAVNWDRFAWSQLKNKYEQNKYAPYRPKWADRRKTTYKPKTLKEVLQAGDKLAVKRIRKALQTGILAGDSVNVMKRAITDVFEQTGRNTERIIRTESQRLVSSASYLNNENMKDQGIDASRVWDATLDTRTREQSAEMDGQPEDKNGLFHYPNGATGRYPGDSGVAEYDINERCTANTLIDGKNPDLRRVRDPETGETRVVSYQNFNDYAKENNLTRSKYGEPYKLK